MLRTFITVLLYYLCHSLKMFLARTKGLLVTAPRKVNGRFLQRAFFANESGSHDDFLPKKKTPEEEMMKEVLELIGKQVKENPVMLYMKGTPQRPQCGFSLQAVRILNAVGVDFSSVNVLEYPAIREGVKLYSEWPTIPQLYINGEFIGGADILTNMFQDGQLEKVLKEKNLLK